MGSDVRDLVALTNEVLSISITQKKEIKDTNIIFIDKLGLCNPVQAANATFSIR